MNILELKHVTKSFRKGGTETLALNDVSLTLKKGESLAIMGTSGSGKSTLLNIIGGLDKPTSGTVHVNDKNIFKLKENDLSKFRNQTIGFVFQFFNLLDYLTAVENVMVPALISGKTRGEAKDKALELLKQVGLAARANFHPRQLSGGEMQRVAIARSLINSPSLLLADEPTANLDKKSAAVVLDLFSEISDKGLSVVTITHDPTVSSRYKNVVHLSQGEIIEVKD